MANSEPLRIAVIGTGGIAGVHFTSYATKEGVEIVGLSDLSETNLRIAAGKHPKAVAHADWMAMLEKTKPDIVSVCTPNKYHAELSLGALSVGAHVVCEKPMAMNVKEAQEMEDARAKKGVLGLINFSYRNCPSFRFARELVAQGELGTIQRVHVVYLQSFLGAEDSKFSWRNDASIAGFGALGDLGVHMIDAARFITGLSIERVVGVAQTLIPEKADAAGKMHKITTDTNSSFLCQFSGGSLGTFETTQTAPGYGNYFRLEISGSLGTIAVLSEQDDVIWMHQGKVLSKYGTWAKDPLAPIKIPTGFIGAQPPGTPGCIVDVIRGTAKEYPSFADGLAAQKVVDSIFASTKTGAWVDIKE
jgi:predicted dehydrogenase